MYKINDKGEILVGELAVFVPKEQINIEEFSKDIKIYRKRRKAIYIIASIPFILFLIFVFLENETIISICGMLFGVLVFLAIIMTWGTIIYLCRKYNCSARNFTYSEAKDYKKVRNH